MTDHHNYIDWPWVLYTNARTSAERIIVTVLEKYTSICRNFCRWDACKAREGTHPLRMALFICSRICIKLLGIRQGHSCTHGWSRVGCDLLVFRIHSFVISRGTKAQNKLLGVMYGRNRPKQFIISDTQRWE